MGNVDPLEAWVDESLRRAASKTYHPMVFIGMRERHGTVEAMERLVRSGVIQSGFFRLKELDLLEWSCEAGILRFADRFTEEARQCAQFRLDHHDDPLLRSR